MKSGSFFIMSVTETPEAFAALDEGIHTAEPEQGYSGMFVPE